MFDWLLKALRPQQSAGNEPSMNLDESQPKKGGMNEPPESPRPTEPPPPQVPPEPEYKPNPKELSILALIKAAQGVDERCDTKNLHRLRVALRDFHSIVVMGEMPEKA